MRIVAVYNIKGGVGKTATAVNLAYLSAASGARTLLWDLDPQGAATFYFRIRPRIKGGVKKLVRGRKSIDRYIRGTDFEDLDLLPSDFSYRKLDLALSASGDPRKRLARLVKPLGREYDHLYLDCAPNITLASEGVFAAADALLVPTIPTTLSLRTLSQLEGHLDDEGPRDLRVLPFYSMVDRRKAMHRDVCSERRAGAYEFLETEIPYSAVVEQMGLERKPLPAYAPHSEAAKSYEKLWREVLARTNSLHGWFGRILGGTS